MEIKISNLFCMGLSTGELRKLPNDLGVEVFIECGSDYYWHKLLPKLLNGRSCGLSIHGPFQNIDLSDPQADFKEIFEEYRRAFQFCRDYGSPDCVCHPYGSAFKRRGNLGDMRKLCLERIMELDQCAKGYGVTLLVENMPEKEGLLNQEQFLELFAPNKELSFLIDTGHANIQGWDMNLTWEVIGQRILGYHINDNDGSIDSHLKVGEGSFDWNAFFKGVVKYTPTATLVPEYNFGPLSEVIDSAEKIRNYVKLAYEQR